MSGVCKRTVKSLIAGAQNSFVIVNNGERAVWTFTLRDSAEDFINVTVWGSVEFVSKLSRTHHIGSVVEVINPRVLVRHPDDRNESFVPTVPSPYSLTANEEVALVQAHEGDKQQYEGLLTLPIRSVDTVQSLKTILESIETRNEEYVNILIVVTFIGSVRNITTKDGRDIKCRNFEAFDGSTDEAISLMLWEYDWVERARSWEVSNTVLFITDARIVFDNFKKKKCIAITKKTLITENPDVSEAEAIKIAARRYNPENMCSTPFVVPDPQTITTEMSIQEISKRLNEKPITDGNRTQFATIVKAVVTEMNIDNLHSSLIITKCILCKRVIADGCDSCMNLECPYGNGTRTPHNVTSINIKVNLKDDTGYLIGCRLSGDAAEDALGCPASEFQKMALPEREDLKWKYLLEKCVVHLHVIGPSTSFPTSLYNILSIKPICSEDNDEN